jgi:hypothetical protein
VRWNEKVLVSAAALISRMAQKEIPGKSFWSCRGFAVGTENGLYLHRGLGGIVQQHGDGAAGKARFG